MNYLPLKLEKLRKHYNYSQSYLADVLGVDVVDYMGYENGRNMINYSQVKKLASLYHISVSEIFRNDEEVTLYDVAEGQTDKINIEYFIPKKTLLTRAKEKPLLSGAIVGLLIVLIIGSLLSIRRKNRPYVSYADDTDRLSVSDTSVLYIDNLGAVKGSGDNSNGQISNLPSEHATKVAEGSNFSVILLDDGTVTSIGLIENYQKELTKWKNIVDIAAGNDHVVGVDNNGKVHFVGDNSYGQCDLQDFSNIKNIYCLPHGTVGVEENGEVHFTGDFVGKKMLNEYTSILDVDGNDNNLIVLKKDGTCDYVASYDDSIYLKVLSWKGIIEVACGDDYFAGLKSDGTVVVASLSLNEDIISSWNKVVAIDGGKNYLICYDSENIKGVGKNDYHQFESKETSLQTLAKVKNILVDYDSKNVNVSFDEVTNALEYEVTLIIDDSTKINKTVKANESAKFDTKDLTDNNLYEISVIAKGDNKVYGDSLEAKQEFVYINGSDEVSDEKIKIRSNLSGSYRGDFEEYLKDLGVSEDRIEGSVALINDEEPLMCDGTVETVLDINGITPGATYTKTELKARNVTYTYCKLVIESPIEDNETTDLED
ncbi:MAG: helix-turn-helix domain-containing protein [Erysipelotrichaceae bacterium]|nr:helix-turn-helix domain-containing protein [Erysipelotrichaceae bacterium]